MAVTNGMLTALFAGSGRRPAFTAGQRTKVLAWLKAGTNPVDVNGTPRNATNDDLADYFYDYLVSNTKGHMGQLARGNVDSDWDNA